MSTNSKERARTPGRVLDRATYEALWKRASRNLRDLRGDNRPAGEKRPAVTPINQAKGRGKAKRA